MLRKSWRETWARSRKSGAISGYTTQTHSFPWAFSKVCAKSMVKAITGMGKAITTAHYAFIISDLCGFCLSVERWDGGEGWRILAFICLSVFCSFAFLVHDNSNLQELFPENVQNNLEILNGNMIFHYNRKLCYNKILKFQEKVKMQNKTENSISESTNGDQMPCKKSCRRTW